MSLNTFKLCTLKTQGWCRGPAAPKPLKLRISALLLIIYMESSVFQKKVLPVEISLLRDNFAVVCFVHKPSKDFQYACQGEKGNGASKTHHHGRYRRSSAR